jgi:hypothetical protein
MLAGVALNQALHHHAVTISPGIAVCFQSVLLPTHNSKRSLTLSAAAPSAGMLSFVIAPP